MNNDKNSVQQATLTVGEQLRQARESLNLSFEDIAKQISLRPAILQQIENDQFTHKSIPATFMKGYVRSYAKLLKLPDELWQSVDFGDVQKNDLGKNARTTQAVNQYSSHSRWVGWLSLLVFLVLATMTGLWWWENYQKSNVERENLVQSYNAQQTPTENENIASENTGQNEISLNLPATQDNPPLTLNLQPVNASLNDQPAPAVMPVAAPAPQVQEEKIVAVENVGVLTDKTEKINTTTENESTPKNDPVNQSAVISPVELQIEVLADCWISVKDRFGKILAQREYKQGHILSFKQGEPYDLIIGAPNAVKITYKGEPYPLKVDGRVAKFKLQ